MTAENEAERTAEVDPGTTPLHALVREEWPAVDVRELAEAGDDDDRIVEVVTRVTEHTRTLVRRQLAELRRLAAPAVGGERDPLRDLLGGRVTASQAEAAARKLAERASAIARELRREAEREASVQVRKNPIASLFVALGFGLLLGLWLSGGGRARRR